jgi:RNA polymerase sigma-70 factor (ECF subfamily)
MGYLRLVRSPAPGPAVDSGCIEAFDRELDFLFENLHRLGAATREIEDLAQEVFVVLHKNWAKVDLDRPLRPYLFGIAYRLVAANRRRRAREIPAPALDMEDAGVSPQGNLERKESLRILMAALERVPVRRRAVLIMHDLEDIPIVEIARSLSLTRFGTYARLRKARAELITAASRQMRSRRPK